MLTVQRRFFDTEVQEKTRFGVHYGKQYSSDNELDFIRRIRQAAFAEVGEFRLIDPEYGDEHSFYIPTEEDRHFDQLKKLEQELKDVWFEDHQKRRVKKQELQEHLRRMGDRIVQVRIRKDDTETSISAMTRDYSYGIRKLAPGCYDEDEGLSFAKRAIL